MIGNSVIHELSQRFYFESAHTLARRIDAAPSKRIHGHTYHAEVTLRGTPDPGSGMVYDLGRVRRAIEDVRLALDHAFLDDVPGLGPATLENLCGYIHRALAPVLPGLVRVAVERTASGDKCELKTAAGESAATP